VQFVKHAQELGFSLREIRELLSLRAAPRARCADVKRRAETKIREIEAKIRALLAMRRALVGLMSQCDGKLPASACPILESLDDGRETA
jgi:MerR family mercuric resistance operon transcriptional regulator